MIRIPLTTNWMSGGFGTAAGKPRSTLDKIGNLANSVSETISAESIAAKMTGLLSSDAHAGRTSYEAVKAFREFVEASDFKEPVKEQYRRQADGFVATSNRVISERAAKIAESYALNPQPANT